MRKYYNNVGSVKEARLLYRDYEHNFIIEVIDWQVFQSGSEDTASYSNFLIVTFCCAV